MRRARPGSIQRGGGERAPARRAPLAAAVLAWCAAGCFSDRGLAIEIDVGETGATSVELYIGKRPCDTDAPIGCGAITPPDAPRALGGRIWFRDDVVPYRVEVKGRTATFQIRTDKPETMPILIAIGMVPGDPDMRAVGSATLLDVAIPVDGARVARATLVGAIEVEARLPGPNAIEDRIQVWKKEMPASSCVMVEHWKEGTATRHFVVPIEDPDCDDVPRPECNEAAYHGTSPGAGVPGCITSSGSEGCVLASLGCTDDTGPDPDSCMPLAEPVCVPMGFCDCTDLDAGCMKTAIDTNIDLPRVECSIPARMVGTGLELCSGMASASIELGPLVHDASCGPPLIGSLQPRDAATSHSFEGAVLGLSSPSSTCSIPITWKGGARTVLDESRAHGLIEVPFGDRALLLPLALTFTVGCVTAFECTVHGLPDDSLWRCVP
jgi:hypothetical protein